MSAPSPLSPAAPGQVKPDQMKAGRVRFSEETVYPSIAHMMEGAAAAAVRIARKEHGTDLNFGAGSLLVLDELLGALPIESLNLESETKLWGGYFGEVVRRSFGGEWDLTLYPGGVAAVPTLIVRGSHLYPLMKIYRRLTLGELESVAAFYEMIAARLGQPQTEN